MKSKRKIIILGAGPAGLITGWLLSKKNWDVTIIEKQNRMYLNFIGFFSITC